MVARNSSLVEKCRGISLGIFAGDLSDLKSEAQDASSWGCRMLHFDVMDGIFVPQMTGGPGFVSSLRGDMLLDVHLMVQRPAEHVESYVMAGADILTVHCEAEDCANAVRKIRSVAAAASRDVLVGVSLMPDTTLENAADVLALEPDLVLVLALDPRRQERADIVRACNRVSELRERLPDTLIAFDGGVTRETMPEISAALPDVVVSGSAVMKAQDRRQVFEVMSKQLRR